MMPTSDTPNRQFPNWWVMCRDIRLDRFESTLIGLRGTLERHGHVLSFELQKGASEEVLDDCERRIRLRLPPTLRMLLRQHNGAALSIDHDPAVSHDLYLYSADAIISEDSWLRESLAKRDRCGRSLKGWQHDLYDADHFWTGLIAFANYGVGICLLDTDQRTGGECAVVDLDVEDTENTRAKVLADSLQSWFEQVLASAERQQRFVYWLPNVDGGADSARARSSLLHS